MGNVDRPTEILQTILRLPRPSVEGNRPGAIKGFDVNRDGRLSGREMLDFDGSGSVSSSESWQFFMRFKDKFTGSDMRRVVAGLAAQINGSGRDDEKRLAAIRLSSVSPADAVKEFGKMISLRQGSVELRSVLINLLSQINSHGSRLILMQTASAFGGPYIEYPPNLRRLASRALVNMLAGSSHNSFSTVRDLITKLKTSLSREAFESALRITGRLNGITTSFGKALLVLQNDCGMQTKKTEINRKMADLLIQDLIKFLPPITGKATHYSATKGEIMASGQGYDSRAMAAAYNGIPGQELPSGTRVRVTNTANGKSVTVVINDHGPWIIRKGQRNIPYPAGGRRIDLTPSAFAKIADMSAGVINIKIEVLQPGSGPMF